MYSDLHSRTHNSGWNAYCYSTAVIIFADTGITSLITSPMSRALIKEPSESPIKDLFVFHFHFTTSNETAPS